jgi:hypothetical protein
MTELRDELTRVLRAVDAGQAPVEETMRLGRVIRTRRRVAIAAGALAVIAAVVGFPALAHHLAGPRVPPVQPKDPVITDTPPAPGASAGTIAQGTIGTRRWHVGLQREGTPPATCLTGAVITPATGATTDLGLACTLPPVDPAFPAGFTSFATSGIEVQLGAVAPNVAYFTLKFTDGQQLKLIPVTSLGHRYIAFVAPVNMPIASLTAHMGSVHSVSGQTVTAIPFSIPGRIPDFQAWQRQGQPLPPRITTPIGSGTVDGKPWQVTAYQGPWGICLVFTGGGECTTGTGAFANRTDVQAWGFQPFVGFGDATADVAYVKLTMPDGSVLPKFTPVKVGNARLFPFAAPGNRTPKRWTAFSASGAQLASGTFQTP